MRALRCTKPDSTHKLMAPRWMGMNGALATRSPSGANKAQEKSSLSLMFVLIEVCWSERPIASATLMNRFAKRVSRIGSGPLLPGSLGSIFESDSTGAINGTVRAVARIHILLSFGISSAGLLSGALEHSDFLQVAPDVTSGNFLLLTATGVS